VEGAIDGEVELGRLRRGVARGGRNSGGRRLRTGPDQAEELEEEVRKLWASEIWAG
jgi:hypothetical protein